MKSNFNEWTLEKIEDEFNVIQVDELPMLKTWCSFEYEISEFERTYLLRLQKNYLLGGDEWNEIELENKFISPLFVFAEIDNKKFAYFLERELKVAINNYELLGKVDGMIASGFRSPKKPFFCMNEYKRQTEPYGDPKGQVLIAMIAAQAINNHQQPIFGCYIIGKLWHFVVLSGNEYAISTSYTCDTNDIFDIYRIIKGLKYSIEQII